MDSKDYALKSASDDESPYDAGTETLEQVPTHYTSNTKSDIAPFPTADFPDRLAEDVSYGPGGVKGLWSNPYVFGAAFLASLGGFSFGYDQGVISVINVMPQFHAAYPRLDPEDGASAFWKGFMTGMLELGAFLACFFFPWMADRISRKWALSVVSVIFNIGAIMQTAAPNYAVLVAGRTITGVGVGTLALGAPLYIAEISPPAVRGALLVLESLAIVCGVVLSYWISYGTQYIEGEASFRIAFGLQMVSAVCIGIGIHAFPYSPRWLALVGRDDDALTSLAKLRQLPTSDNRVVTEWRGILAEIEFKHVMLEKMHPGQSGWKLELLTWMDLFNKKVWRRTAVGVGVAFFQQFSGTYHWSGHRLCAAIWYTNNAEPLGVNAFIYYAPTLFTSLGQADLSLILAGTLNIGQLAAVAVAFVIIDLVGRRSLAIWGAVGMGLPYIVISVLYALYSHDWPGNPVAGWVCVAMACKLHFQQ